MPVNKLGTATIGVEADLTGLGKGLTAKLKAALAGSEKEGKAAGKRIGKNIIDGIGNEILRQTPALRRRINLMLRGISVNAKVKLNVDVDSGSSQLKGIAARIRGNIEGEIGGGLKSASGALQGLVGNLFPKSLLQLSLMVSLGALLGTVLAGAFNATGRELLNVVKLSAFLPAALSVVIATVAAFKIGILGVNDALSAVFSRDPEKLNEALKKLTPSARSFVLEFQKALPLIDMIKARTQESLFKPLKGIVSDIFASLGPTALRGLSQVAGAIGGFLATIGGGLVNPATQKFLDDLFSSTASIINVLAGPITNLVKALINAADTALPGLTKLAGGSFGGFIQKVADWINQVVSDGRFQGWLDSAQRTLDDIWYVVKEVAKLFGVLFDDASTDGRSFLEIIGDLIKKFREWASSNDGKFALEGIATAAKLAGLVLIGLIATIFIIIAAVGSFVNAVKSAIDWVGRLVGVSDKVSAKNVTKGLVKLPGHASGAIVTRPELATLAEAGPEVVIPLTRPGRARQLAKQSGLTDMLGSGQGGKVTQIFYLGEEQVDARIVKITDTRITDAVNDASSGVRAA